MPASTDHVFLQSVGEVRATKPRSFNEFIDFRAASVITEKGIYNKGAYESANNGLLTSNNGYLVLRSINSIVYAQGTELIVTSPTNAADYRPVKASSYVATNGGFVGSGNTTFTTSSSDYVVVRSGANTQPVYLQGSEIRATLPSNGGAYVPVRASSFPTGSMAEFKQDITEHKASALDLIKSAKIYDYRLKTEVSQGIDRVRTGLIIGDGYQTPKEVIDGDGVEQYMMNSLGWKAIQELDTRISTETEILKKRIKELENQIQVLQMTA